MMNSVKSILWSLVLACMALGLSAQKKVEISVDINLKESAEVEVEPFTNFSFYTLARAPLDEKGKAVLQIDTKTPFMAALKVKTAMGKLLCMVSVYVEPGAKLGVSMVKREGEVNPNVVFEGKLSAENEVLKRFKMTVLKLSNSRVNPDEALRQIEEELNKQSYSSGFKNYVMKSIGLLVRVKKLPGLESDTDTYRKALQALLRDLKREDCWQSVPQWPNELDDLFTRCESEELIPVAEDGLSHRLQFIGDENLRIRYGVFALKRLVNSRAWFENPPTGIIENLKPYLTTGEAKQEWESIVTKFGYIEKGWEHLRHQPAPDFNFEDVNGKMVKLSDYRGKFVILDIWNIYCGPCMQQVPYLQKLEPELEKMNVVVIGVSCDPQNIKDKWRNTVREKQMAGIQVIMDKGRSSKFLLDYAVVGFPTFCLIGPDGMVINPGFKRPEAPDFMKEVQKRIDDYNVNH